MGEYISLLSNFPKSSNGNKNEAGIISKERRRSERVPKKRLKNWGILFHFILKRKYKVKRKYKSK